MESQRFLGHVVTSASCSNASLWAVVSDSLSVSSGISASGFDACGPFAMVYNGRMLHEQKDERSRLGFLPRRLHRSSPLQTARLMAGFRRAHTNPESHWQRRQSFQSPRRYLIQLARKGVSRCLIKKLAGFSSEP
jgi:hypothetical protein